jgi:alpha,alpha-trehalose phosphorylase
LIANEPGAAPPKSDPRAAAVLESPLRSEEFFERASGAVLLHSTKRSELRMGAAMDHVFEGPDGTELFAESSPHVGRVTVTADLADGDRLRVVKFLAYGWSSRRSVPAIRDQVIAALAEARHTGWDGLFAAQRAYLDDFWDRADVELEGDIELQQAVRFALFHTLQAGARAEQRAIAAKGLTGPGYDGHTFWDTERFVLPVLTYTAPEAAADALRWRHSTLDLARERATQLGLEGAAFPWRTIRGQECSGYWPAGTAAFHISGAIADAVRAPLRRDGRRHLRSRVRRRTARRDGALVAVARPSRSAGALPNRRRHRPDEYSALTDNNVYTNLLAQKNLRACRRRGRAPPALRSELDADFEEAAIWRDAADEDGHPVGRDARRPSPVRRVHRAPGVGLRAHGAGAVPAAPALPLLRPVPQAGRQAGRPRSRRSTGAAMRSATEEKLRDFDYYEG